MELQLKDKVALVTGATRGIGRAIALGLAGEGAKIMLTGRDVPLLETVAREAEALGGAPAFHAGDLADPAEPARLVAAVQKTFGKLDILVNNAGTAKRGEFLTMADSLWDDGFGVKFFGAMRLARTAWPMLRDSKGTVLTIAGGGGRTPSLNAIIGSSVNAACLAFTKALAELGYHEGVQVNAINPGTVATERFVVRLRAHMERTGLDADAAREDFARKREITRLGVPEDIASLVTFMESPKARWLHGAIVDMDGGRTKTL